MLRERLNDRLKAAMKDKNARAVATLRLILAALKDRDIAARSKGQAEGISDPEILQVLQTMIRQRQDAIKLYEQGGRLELAEQEAEEIAIIESFLPQQLGEQEIKAAVREVVSDVGAKSIKDMGRAMAELRQRYAGQMDFGRASAVLKEQLGAV